MLRRSFISVLFFPALLCLGQAPDKKQIDAYVRSVNSLLARKELVKYSYPQMSLCGGALHGYYYQGKLVLIEATHGGQFGANSQQVYLKDTIIYKLLNREYWGDEEAYRKNYPEDEEIDPEKMRYSDTLHTVYLTEQPLFITSSRRQTISKAPDPVRLNYFLNCARFMQQELRTEKVRG